ncbi:hypothetical protein ACQPZF_01835 [Actinosynnema sp. CS-041913]|uniref:hypothetical protein n=1 Tax=Actinosynnema sp. CS-041913 TaxID=3239917 RepID=UPI003D913909
MAAPLEVPFSELINKPKDTLAKLKQTPDGRLRLRRRDAEDLMLTTVSRAANRGAAESVASRLLAAMLVRDAHARGAAAEAVREIFPWVRYLSEEGVHEFVAELVDTLNATADLDTDEPVQVVVIAWKNTADILADPVLLAHLQQDHYGDFGPVPMPAVEE